MTGVLTCILATSLALTYGTLARSSEDAVRVKLESAARQVATTARASAVERGTMLSSVALDPAIRTLLAVRDKSRNAGTGLTLDERRQNAGAASDSARLVAAAQLALAQLVSPSDSMLPVELWTTDGRRVAHIGPDADTAPRPASPRRGHPVAREGLEAIAPSDSVSFGELFGVNGRAYFWTVAPVAAISLILIAGGAVASWILSRRITTPIMTLTTAAEAIAHGDYARRVNDADGDEIGRLAASFNTMAGEVDASHVELEQRVRDARSAARALESANQQLQLAMTQADESRKEAELARADAERANHAKSDFLAVMSHELRTPLNAIGGYAQLLELEVHGPVTEPQRDALGRITRSQAHLLHLINDVLNFARLDARQVQFAMADVPVDEALAGLETLVAPQVRARGLTLSYRPCGPHVTVGADRDKLQQIVLNLLTNAIKFTPASGLVEVTCEECEDVVKIRVHDTGVGIPPDRLETVFDPFVQVDRALHHSNDGVGLGLAISRDLARGMGGDVQVASTVGKGSVFVLLLARGAVPPRPVHPPGEGAAHANRFAEG